MHTGALNKPRRPPNHNPLRPFVYSDFRDGNAICGQKHPESGLPAAPISSIFLKAKTTGRPRRTSQSSSPPRPTALPSTATRRPLYELPLAYLSPLICSHSFHPAIGCQTRRTEHAVEFVRAPSVNLGWQVGRSDRQQSHI